MRQQQSKKTFFAVLFAAICAIAIIFQAGAWNVQAAELSVYESDSATASSGCVFLGLEGEYLAGAQEALDRINTIRYEACKEGVPDPRDSSRNLTLSDYVPIKWSADLERIARIRAAEASITKAHARVNGQSIWSVTLNGVRSWGEVLAWNYSKDVVTGVDQWYEEKADWLDPSSTEETGHYEQMINPSNTYVGVSAFYSDAVYRWPNSTAGSFSSVSSMPDQTMLQPSGKIIQKLDVSLSNINAFDIGTVYEGEDTMPKLDFTVNGCRMSAIATPVFVSTNPDIFTVGADGSITGKARGSATLEVILGNYKLTKDITVECRHDYALSEIDANNQITGTCSKCGDTFTASVPTSYKLYWRNSTSDDSYYWSVFPSSNPVGSEVTAWLTSIDGDAGYQELVVESSDESVVQVGNTSTNYKKFKVTNTGLVTLTLYPKYNPDLKTSITTFVGDEGGIDIADAEITLSKDLFNETGKELKPAVTVTYKGKTLANGTYYSVEYQNNVNAGEAKVIVTGEGYFAGTVEKAFRIEHVLSETAAVAPTCEEPGNTAYWTCAVCHKHFTDALGTEEIEENSWVIPATGHTPVIDEAVAATCTETGLTEGSHCEVCGNILVEQTVIPAKGHTEVLDEAKAATCTETGRTEGTHCSVCGEVLKDQDIIPALGHTVVTDAAIEATCTEDGLTEGNHCSVCGDILVAQQVVPATGHSPAEAVVENATERICGQPSTYDEVVYCKTCGEELSRERKTTDVLPHSPATLPAVEPTCTETGLTEGSYCTYCGEMLVEQLVIPAKGHEVVVDEAKEATCTEDGLTEGSHCKTCGEILQAQTMIQAKGHTPVVTREGREATCTEDGLTEESYCSECGEVLSEQNVIPAKGHIPVTDPAVAATYTKTGLTKGSHCSICGEVLTAQKVVPKLVRAANKITKVTTKKVLKYKTLKKKKQTFTISAKAKETKKLTYKLSSVTKKARKYITVSKAGKVTVKKGLKKGNYKLTVKITAPQTAHYKKTTVTKTITIQVK